MIFNGKKCSDKQKIANAVGDVLQAVVTLEPYEMERVLKAVEVLYIEEYHINPPPGTTNH